MSPFYCMFIIPPFKKNLGNWFKWVPKDGAEISSLFLSPLVPWWQVANRKDMLGVWTIHWQKNPDNWINLKE